jgi:hypothetical protein
LKKRTSINSIPKIHKEKEMADFRKWLFALAVVALLAGLSVPASAQSTTVCTVQSATDNLGRAEGYTELAGDVLLACTGGTPTALGQPVPQITIQIFLSQNVTSKITAVTGSSSTGSSVFLEALLIVDEPNSSLHPNTPLLNCGYSTALAPDTSLSGPGVCSIFGTGGLASTDFTNNTNPTSNTTTTYNGAAGHPNVFQGRQALSGNNSVVFQGVPFDPPGTLTRYLRFTNVRVNANGAGIAQANQTSVITMGIASSGNNVLQLSIASQAVLTVLKGLNSSTVFANTSFAQCISQAKGLLTASPEPPFGSTATCGSSSCDVGTSPTNNTFTSGFANPMIRFSEGFASSWKVKNVNFTLSNMVYTGGTAGSDAYSYSTGASTNPINYPTDLDQNVPGVAYNAESGFMFPTVLQLPTPNPPLGFQTSQQVNNGAADIYAFSNGTTAASTGFSGVGIATQGTRLAAALANVPNGLSVYVAPVLYLYRQGTTYTNGPNTNNGLATGVMVLTNTASDGSGTYNPPSGLAASTAFPPTNQPLQAVTVTNGSALVVYEVLATDVYTLEYVDVPFVVAYTAQLSANAPIGLPQPNVIATYATGFAPFYSTSAATLASASLPVPRFVFTGSATNLFEVVKCACNLLFPYVTQAPGYDTGIAIANTTADPYGTTPQNGGVQMWYYGTLTNGGAAPGTQCTNTASPGTCPGTTVVPPGQVLTYTLYNGSAQWGLDNRGAGFTGYMIAQTQFQYCHAFAFIGGLGGGPAVNSSTNGLSEGYLALILDAGTFVRGAPQGESLSQ